MDNESNCDAHRSLLRFLTESKKTAQMGQMDFAKNRVDVGSYPQHLSLHRTYGSRIRRYIHIGERKL